MRLASAALALATATAAPAPATPTVRVESATRAFPFLREFWRIEPAARSRFGLTYRLAERNRPSGAELTLVDGPDETPLTATPDGWLTRLPTAQAFARDATVRETVPAGVRVSHQISCEATLPALDNIEVADLRAAVAQIAALAHRAGPLEPLIPRFTRVIFSGAQGASEVRSDGTLKPLPLLHGEPALDLADAADVATVRFLRPPYHVLLVPGRRPGERAPSREN